MNSNLIAVVASFLVMLPASGFALSSGLTNELKCETAKASDAYQMHLTVQSKNFMQWGSITGKNNGWTLSEPIVTATYTDYNGELTTKVGRRDVLSNDKTYAPRKYLGTMRFQLEKLIDAKEFREFLPNDECKISLMIPRNALLARNFQAFAVASCDQSGGSQTLNCTLTEKNP